MEQQLIPSGTKQSARARQKQSAESVPKNQASLVLDNLRKDFGETAAVDGISLSVPQGSFLVLLGPSGCGKTTTLRMLAGLENPTGGSISFGDRVIATGDGSVMVPPAKRNAGLVFQSYALWPHKTVRENISWPLSVAKWSKAAISERVLEVLELLEISTLADRYPGEISGGQQQRVAIARMIAPEPSHLLFDEPLSNLDAKLRVDTRGELMRIHRATGATSVYVTHDQVEALTMATHIALMRDGKIEQFGTPEQLVNAPATAFAATFIGTPPCNVLDAELIDGQLDVYGIPAGRPNGLGEMTNIQVMYRPTSLSVGLNTEEAYLSALTATFIDQVPMADRWVVGVAMPGGSRASIIKKELIDARPGDTVRVTLSEHPDAIYGSDGRVIEVSW